MTPEHVEEGGAEGTATTYANQKGGTGKSTTTANNAASEAAERADELGIDAADLEGDILVIDLDDQCDVTESLGLVPNTDAKVRVPNPQEHGILALMMDEDLDPLDAVRRTKYGVDVIPGHPEMNRLEASLAGELLAHAILATHTGRLRRRYRRIHIDCPGSLGIATINGLVAADEVMVPVSPGTLELKGLVRLDATIKKISLAYKLPNLTIDFILITDYDKRESIATGTRQRLGERFPQALLETVVPRSVRVPEAPGYGEPMCVYDPGGPADTAFREVVKEMRKRRVARG
jgi:chromosome partitioning protein